LQHEVIVEEKIDGSQFSFGIYGDEHELRCRSKGAQINIEAPQKMFASAVEYVKSISNRLALNWTYRGEVLERPKHNVLAYDRRPDNGIIIWDIDKGNNTYLRPAPKKSVAAELNLECVPVLYRGKLTDLGLLRALLDTMSILGGQKIEGVVIKPASYNVWGPDKKLLVAKFVSEAFKEVHSATWKQEHGNKAGRDILAELAASYATPARWNKAKIHLAEAGLLEGSMRDIANLIKEIPTDVEKECADEIKQRLWDWAWPQLKRSLVKGLPEHYKEQLLQESFSK
jgi:hypothetical protein